ncbi:MAG: AAA family ATPase, partial [Okeania sp. SIO2H7]|nr:AAA family ATPase [Okeania sp. SIO2H7]
PPNNTKPRIDRADAPDIDYSCDRPDELATLKNCILEKRDRLVAISGISGMGKTAIALQLLSQIEDKFDRVIWKSLRGAPTPETTLKSLIQFFSNTPQNRNNQNVEERLSLLIEYLRNHRCLIILDDLHRVLEKEKLVGHYQRGWENYRTLFETIAELSHQSCLIFNSWELPLEIVDLKNKNAPVSCLQLEGLGKAANKILEKAGLLDKEKWSELIDIYGGNPHWLKIAAAGIKDLFGGRVSEYLQYQPLFLGDELTVILERHLSRLSELERQILLQISPQKEPVSIAWLRESSDRSSSDILNAIRSLGKRSLLEKIEGQNSTLFAVKRIFKEYLLERSSIHN